MARTVHEEERRFSRRPASGRRLSMYAITRHDAASPSQAQITRAVMARSSLPCAAFWRSKRMAMPTVAAASPATASRQLGSPSISTFSIAAFIAPRAIEWKFGAAMERHHPVGEHAGATGRLLATTVLRLVLTFI